MAPPISWMLFVNFFVVRIIVAAASPKLMPSLSAEKGLHLPALNARKDLNPEKTNLDIVSAPTTTA